MRKIVAIGGGEIKDLETLKIDREIVRLAGKTDKTYKTDKTGKKSKKSTRALFIPTASSHAEDYWKNFQNVYGRKLGCRTDALFLIRDRLSKEEIKRKILSSELIYVGGGNTLKMMRVWRRFGVDKLLKTALNKGIVLSGLSAGSVCWFRYGHSDSLKFYSPRKWKYIRVRGLGFINATCCPHYHGARRKKEFQKMIRKKGGTGIAMDDNCAIQFMGKEYRVITSKRGASAYRVYRRKGKIVTERIEQKKEFAPISDLLKR